MDELPNDLCLFSITRMTRHADGHLFGARRTVTEIRRDLPMLDSVWVYAVDKEETATVVVRLRLRGDDGFLFEMVSLKVADRDLLRLREYLESADMTEVEAHILADKIIGCIVDGFARAAVESEVA